MSEVTQLLQRWSDGDRTALEQVLPLVYDELRTLAARQLSGERHDHTLQITGLVNEAYMRLSDQRSDWTDRRHFLLTANMRRILVTSRSRGGQRQRRIARIDRRRRPGAMVFDPDLCARRDMDGSCHCWRQART